MSQRVASACLPREHCRPLVPPTHPHPPVPSVLLLLPFASALIMISAPGRQAGGGGGLVRGLGPGIRIHCTKKQVRGELFPALKSSPGRPGAVEVDVKLMSEWQSGSHFLRSGPLNFLLCFLLFFFFPLLPSTVGMPSLILLDLGGKKRKPHPFRLLIYIVYF